MCSSDLISVLSSRGEADESERKIEIKENLKAPLKEGEAVGEIIIIKNGSEIGRSDICVLKTVEKKTFFVMFGDILNKLMG